MDNQLDMRSNHLMLSSGKPILDENGNVVDFDFSEMIKEGKMAIDKGFTYIYGGLYHIGKSGMQPNCICFGIWILKLQVLSISTAKNLFYKL